MKKQPHVAILTSQYFGWGIYGGFGSMARQLAENLVQVGYRVTVIVPRRQNQKPLEQINGVEVHSFSPLDIKTASRLISTSSADIFHSQDPTLLTYLAQKLLPNRIHLVTCCDPRDWRDWWIEFYYATHRRRLLTPFNYLTEAGFLVNRAVQQAHGVFCPAYFLRQKTKRMYRLAKLPGLLPYLIDVPAKIPAKDSRPTFTFIARWDKRKRPQLFLELAKEFPQYRFVAAGQGSASAEAGYDAWLRRQYAHLPNLELPGLVNRFETPQRLNQILAETWVLVNTAVREGLPLTFLEAAAYGCAIVSSVNPDGFATRFGWRVENDTFAPTIRALLAESPLEKGQAAHQYVKETYERTKALAAHLEQYQAYVG